MDEGEGRYLTGSVIGDGIVGFIAAGVALTAFWVVGLGISLAILQLFANGIISKDPASAQLISGFFVAPVLAWILAMLLVRPIKRKYRTLGRSYQATEIVYGVIYFGGLGVCLTLLASMNRGSFR